MTGVVTRIEERAREEKEAYAHGEDRPLAGYAVLLTANLGLTAALVSVARRRGVGLPQRLRAADLALLGVATHKIARIVAKEPINSPLRAPFARYEGVSGPAELAEEVRGTGIRKAIGELIGCPFCIGEWIAVCLTAGLVMAPRATRLVATIFTTLTISDALQFAYAKLEETAA